MTGGQSQPVSTGTCRGAETTLQAGPGPRPLRPLLTHHAISALICKAATEAAIYPDRVEFKRTVRIRRRAAVPAVFPPEQRERTLDAVMAGISRKKHLNPKRRYRTYPREA